ncbi:DUF1472 domain-containing protein [Salmonella enterica subsp. enterica serovar Kotte]|nr:DUF1472 domain-containing protein [Salmonella enterica subsp. enterica serovar Kotte]
MSRSSSIPAHSPRCYVLAIFLARRGLRLTPCLYSSPTAANARVRFAAILARSQFFLRWSPFFPSFSRSIFAR